MLTIKDRDFKDAARRGGATPEATKSSMADSRQRALLSVSLGQHPRTSDSTALGLCALMALTAKGVAEGWEPLKQWSEYELAEAYSRLYGVLDHDAWKRSLIEVSCIDVFRSSLSRQSGVLYFNPAVGRDSAVLMLGWCYGAAVSLRHTLHEALEGIGAPTNRLA